MNRWPTKTQRLGPMRASSHLTHPPAPPPCTSSPSHTMYSGTCTKTSRSTCLVTGSVSQAWLASLWIRSWCTNQNQNRLNSSWWTWTRRTEWPSNSWSSTWPNRKCSDTTSLKNSPSSWMEYDGVNKTLGSKFSGSFQINRQFQCDGYMGNSDLN